MTSRLRTIGTALALPLTLVLATTLVGCSAGAAPAQPHVSKADSTYGSLPSFLPKNTLKNDSELDGSTANPAVTSQGDAVKIELDGGSAIAKVTGPEVPGEGLPYQTEATTCTWTVTITAKGAAVPIRTQDFTSIDHLGKIYDSNFVKGQPRPPGMLQPGQSTTFELRAVMQVGEGLMRWAPDGKHIEGSWDFTVEND